MHTFILIIEQKKHKIIKVKVEIECKNGYQLEQTNRNLKTFKIDFI